MPTLVDWMNTFVDEAVEVAAPPMLIWLVLVVKNTQPSATVFVASVHPPPVPDAAVRQSTLATESRPFASTRRHREAVSPGRVSVFIVELAARSSDEDASPIGEIVKKSCPVDEEIWKRFCVWFLMPTM